jgi:hypothetical protein
MHLTSSMVSIRVSLIVKLMVTKEKRKITWKLTLKNGTKGILQNVSL